MATRTVSFHTLICDGCQTQFGMDVHYASVIEARAAAYTAGWRFPERYTASGQSGKSVSDVCPSCESTWERRPAPDTWARRRGRA